MMDADDYLEATLINHLLFISISNTNMFGNLHEVVIEVLKELFGLVCH